MGFANVRAGTRVLMLVLVLVLVQGEMRKALASYRDTERVQWVRDWPGMCVLQASQVRTLPFGYAHMRTRY